MKKKGADELRQEYQRSDFGTLVRGKYASRLRENSNVVVLDPKAAELSPNSALRLPGDKRTSPKPGKHAKIGPEP